MPRTPIVPAGSALPKDPTGTILGEKGTGGQAGTNWTSFANVPEVAGTEDNPGMFRVALVDRDSWNKAFPYEISIVRLGKDGEYTLASGPTKDQNRSGSWIFRLPIPPEDLQVSMPNATFLAATLDGVVEEHGGAPFRIITLTGTTGVAPYRRATAADAGGGSLSRIAESIVGGTLGAINKTVNNAVRTITGSTPQAPNLHKGLSAADDDFDTIPQDSTGFYQFHLLYQFLEQYLEMKKMSKYNDCRLAFNMWKDQHHYLVTLMKFDFRRSAAKPFEYQYNIVFKAWKRFRTSSSVSPYPSQTSAARDAGIMGQILNRVDAAQQTLHSVADIAKTAVADFDRVLDIGREVVALTKSLAGVALAVSDMPSAFVDSWNDFTKDVQGTLEASKQAFSRIFAGTRAPWEQRIGAKTGPSTTGASTRMGMNGAADYGSLKTTDGITGQDNSNLKDALGDFKTARLMPLSSLPLSPKLSTLIRSEQSRLKGLSRKELEQRRDELQDIAADYADAIGLGSDTYNDVLGRKSRNSSRTPTDDEVRALWAMNDMTRALDRLTSSQDIDKDKTPTSIDFIANLATASGIPFQTPNSKFLAPVPYGMTIEQIAKIYLSDANRWHEIAAVNHLQAPYIDEVGIARSLITNADGDTVVVSSADGLYLGQSVWIGSQSKAKTLRHIAKIDSVGDGMVLVYVDGEPDLIKYTVSDGAYLHSFLPNTLNSQMFMFVPSSLIPTQTSNPKPIPGLVDVDGFLKVGGVDLLLTQSGDLVIGPEGDLRFSYGLTNIVQTARLLIATPKGSILQHPNYGLGLFPGVSVSDTDARSLVKSLDEAFSSDPLFSGLVSATVQKSGPVATLSVAVNIQGTSEPVRIALDLDA